MGLFDSILKLVTRIFNFIFGGLSRIVGFSGDVIKTMSFLEKKSRERKNEIRIKRKWWNKNINNKDEIL